MRSYGLISLTPEQSKTLQAAAGNFLLHPLAIAILGGVMVESELDEHLRRRFKRRDDDMWEKLVGEGGPITSFYTKTLVGYAFKIFDEKIRDDLAIVRTIRNTFAHSKLIINFDDDLICEELLSANRVPKPFKRAITKPKVPERKADLAKAAYIILCFKLTTHLMRRRARANTAASKRRMRRFEQSPLARALAGSLLLNPALPQATSKLNPLAFPAGQSGDPKPEAPQRSFGGLFGLGAELLRKTDK